MTWDDIQRMVNRTLALSVDYYKCLLMFGSLATVGLMVVACKALALSSGAWTAISLQFLPIYAGSAVLMSAGIILARVYHDQVKGRTVDYRKIFLASWRVMLTALYYTVPVVLTFLFFWMALGFFYLLSAIPFLGSILSVVLAFWPFLLNLGILLLVLTTVAQLFFITPMLALRGKDHFKLLSAIKIRITTDPFGQIFQLIVSLLPLLTVTTLLIMAANLTSAMGFTSSQPLPAVLQVLFVTLPAAAVLTPPAIFFFNLAVETHVLAQSLEDVYKV